MIAPLVLGSAPAPNFALKRPANMGLSSKFSFAANCAELRLVCRSGCIVAILPLLLKWWGIRRIVDWLTPRHFFSSRRIPRERVTYLCLRVLGLSEKLSFRVDCLRRSLLLYHCLRLQGAPAVLHFGAKPGASGLLAHCWLTIDGAVYQDRNDHISGFAHMFSLPSQPAVDAMEGRSGEGPALEKALFDG